MCPYEYYDSYLDTVVHPGEDARICNLRGLVVWRDSECRTCWHGKIYRFLVKLCNFLQFIVVFCIWLIV